MKNKKIMKNSGSIFISIIGAAVAGVVIGALVAPEKGDELRRSIKNSVGDWAKKFTDLLREGKEELNIAKSSIGKNVKEFKQESSY